MVAGSHLETALLVNEQMRHDNILLLDPGHGLGGPISFLTSFLKELDKERLRPIVALYFDETGTVEAKIHSLGVKVYSLRKRKNLMADFHTLPRSTRHHKEISVCRKVISNLHTSLSEFFGVVFPLTLDLLKIIKANQIKLVFLNNDPQYHLPGILAAKFSSLPCVCRKAGVGGGNKINRVLVRHIDLFIAISRAAAADITRFEDAKEKTVIVPAGVDLQRFTLSITGTKVKTELGIPDGKKIIGTTSRIDLGKGHEELLKAIPLIIESQPDAVFLIVGDDFEFDGALLKNLKNRVHTLGLDKSVIFTGWRQDIPEILAAIDIFVQNPTSPEGLGISNLEAMAMGKPAVVTNMGGLCDSTIDGVNGFVVPADNALALSKAILKLMGDQDLAKLMGRNARTLAEGNFDIKKNVKKIESLIGSILNA